MTRRHSKERSARPALRRGSLAHLAGGAATRERLSRLLGVEALRRKGFAVSAAAWMADHAEIEIETPEGEVLLLIERAGGDRPGFLRCGDLSLSYRGTSELDPALEAVIRKVAPRALAKVSLENLAELIASDPEAGRAGQPLPSAPLDDQRRFERGSLLSSWGSPEVRSRFFATAELARAQLDSLDYFNQGVFVQHCDPECLFLEPQTGVPMVPLALYPWDDRVRRIDWGRSGRRREPDPMAYRLLATDLDEGDVILGRSPAKLDAALSSLPRSGLDQALIFCSSTCVPVVSGEDTESVVQRHRERLRPAPLLHLTTTPHSMQALLQQLLVDRRREAEAASGPPRPRTVNLIGFSDDPSLDELRELLGWLGVEVNVALIPTLDTELIDRLPEAELHVLHPNEVWQAHYDQLLFGSDIPAISPPAPYGIEGTIRWLDQVAAEVGLEVAVEAALAEPIAEARAAGAPLRERARGHRLGFVVGPDERHLLSRPDKTSGVPLLELVDEMGFEVEVLQPRGGCVPRPRLAPEELAAHLASGRLSAVYSEQFYDHRLTRSGVAGFSLQHFERGLGGYLRTLRRLLEVCDLPFYRRYGGYLVH